MVMRTILRVRGLVDLAPGGDSKVAQVALAVALAAVNVVRMATLLGIAHPVVHQVVTLVVASVEKTATLQGNAPMEETRMEQVIIIIAIDFYYYFVIVIDSIALDIH